ncbi:MULTISPECIES: phosphate acyltransferase PlsX [Gammaproteobacteria]|uniref:phosphate acyltransferase PlsX n=1 Tax=Gammaproteobacteria TaxID=1236 RepID=UPI000DD03F86|nr:MULTISPECIES: phosphate acyltransferase PlsX [Gammaproteobacteria]RTE87284.1 phosphate acyltransferase PlsX [Aliidiomarina sp. B3213]TCZ92930.1 phosphate acyltransferase PlsX [Lysobacter sp. N42]
MRPITLALDAMGGDRGPAIIIAALKRALQAFPTTHFLVFGDEQELKPLLRSIPSQYSSRYQIVHSAQVIEMDDKPGQCIRSKPKASMRLAIDAVAENDADACVSCGNTGALMALSYLKLKTIPGVIRPALVAPLPNQKGHQSFLLDLGANPQCDAETLHQFAVMGSVLATEVARVKRPRVALLNMGEEEIKGNDVVKNAAQLLKENQAIEYVGFIEGNDIFAGKADVIVCDGFTGNVALKSCEGMARLLYENLNQSLKTHWFSKLLALFVYKRLKNSLSWLKPDQYNGASLIGLRGVVIKSHGNASAEAFFSAIKQAQVEAENKLPSRIHDQIAAELGEQS